MKIKVGPIKFKRVMVPDLRSDNDTKLFGEVNHGTCKIRVKVCLNPQQQRQTEWHEIVHIVLEQMGCKEDINNETFVTALAHALMQVVQDNPWLAEEAK